MPSPPSETKETKPNYLSPDSSWTDGYYTQGTVKYAKRTLLSPKR